MLADDRDIIFVGVFPAYLQRESDVHRVGAENLRSCQMMKLSPCLDKNRMRPIIIFRMMHFFAMMKIIN